MSPRICTHNCARIRQTSGTCGVTRLYMPAIQNLKNVRVFQERHGKFSLCRNTEKLGDLRHSLRHATIEKKHNVLTCRKHTHEAPSNSGLRSFLRKSPSKLPSKVFPAEEAKTQTLTKPAKVMRHSMMSRPRPPMAEVRPLRQPFGQATQRRCVFCADSQLKA